MQNTFKQIVEEDGKEFAEFETFAAKVRKSPEALDLDLAHLETEEQNLVLELQLNREKQTKIKDIKKLFNKTKDPATKQEV